MTKLEALNKLYEIENYINNVQLDNQDNWLQHELLTRLESLRLGVQLIKE